MYSGSGNKDMLDRIDGTNEPWHDWTNVVAASFARRNEDIVDLNTVCRSAAKVIVFGTGSPADLL